MFCTQRVFLGQMFMSRRWNHGKLVNSACHSLGSVRLLPCEVFEKHARSKWQEIADAKWTRSTLCHCALSCAFPCSRKSLVAGFHVSLKASVWQTSSLRAGIQRCYCFSRNYKALEMKQTLRGLALYACSSDLLQACGFGCRTQSRWSSDLV